MADLLDTFRFRLPYFADVDDADVQQALNLAANERPLCLTTAGQDEAQIYLAAALLYERQLQENAASSEPLPFGIKSEKEGDLSRTYDTGQYGLADPFGFRSRFEKLAAICSGGMGAITVGNRYCGPCC